MTNNIITGKQNPLIKKALQLRDKKGRQKYGQFLLEGPVVIAEAIREHYPLETILLAADKTKDIHLPPTDTPITLVHHRLLDTLTDTVTKPGIIAIAHQSPPTIPGTKPWAYLDRIQDPGNVGTIIRCADAFDLGGILLATGTVDPYNEKVLRSTMASILRIPLQTKAGPEHLHHLKKQGYTLIGADLQNAIPIQQWHPTTKTVLILGNEAQGLSQDTKELLDLTVTIPMPGRAESLNVGVAAGILMHHISQHVNELNNDITHGIL